MTLFKGRKLLIVTQHGKEAVMKSQLEKALNVTCFVSTGFDTDSLGTFSGEKERRSDPITTLREKCLSGMALYDCDLAIASEGSFGPHPTVFIATADDELVMLIDQKNHLEIVARELSMDTNFSATTIRTESELFEFLKGVKFPLHAIIIKKSKNDLSEMVKGIRDEALALETFRYFDKKYGGAYVETDMRAMHNPTRMKVIGKAIENLIVKINSLCPQCSHPGFTVTDTVKGLPCDCCGYPTKSALYHVYSCQKCSYNEPQYFPRGNKTEDPTYCDRCNP